MRPPGTARRTSHETRVSSQLAIRSGVSMNLLVVHALVGTHILHFERHLFEVVVALDDQLLLLPTQQEQAQSSQTLDTSNAAHTMRELARVLARNT